MKDNTPTLSRSHQLAAKVIYEALKVLKDNGGEMRGKDVLEQVERRVALTPWDKEIYEKSGYIRWQSILHFFTIDCIKAGFLLKKKGIWYLTPEGDEALNKYSDVELLATIRESYRAWKKEQPAEAIPEDSESEDVAGKIGVDLDNIEQLANESIENSINAMGPYEFQDLVAALLRGMGYYTPFIAPKGKDGGIDVIGYRDPLGMTHPRIKVQVKHRENTASVKEVRELIGTLQKDGEVGMFVSSGGFAPDAKALATTSHVHVELIDLNRFINLWRDFYGKMTDEDKSLLPLRAVYFHAPTTV